jgi:hypothetical protein
MRGLDPSFRREFLHPLLRVSSFIRTARSRVALLPFLFFMPLVASGLSRAAKAEVSAALLAVTGEPRFALFLFPYSCKGEPLHAPVNLAQAAWDFAQFCGFFRFLPVGRAN